MSQQAGDGRDRPLRSAPIPSVSYVPGGSASIQMPQQRPTQHQHHHHQPQQQHYRYDGSDNDRTMNMSTSDAAHPKLEKSYSMPANKDPSRQTNSGTPSTRRHATVSRAQSVRDIVTNNVGTFFGVKDRATIEDAPQEVRRESKWHNRRLRHCSRRYGAVKTPTTRDIPDFSDSIIGQLQTQTPLPSMYSARIGSQPSTSERVTTPGVRKYVSAPPGGPTPMSAAPSHIDSTVEMSDHPLSLTGRRFSTTSSMNRSVSQDARPQHVKVVQRRDSVAKMAWDGFTTLLTRGTPRARESYASAQRKHRLRSHSFTPGSIAADDSVFGSSEDVNQLNESGDSANLSIMSGTLGLKIDTTPMETIEEEAERREAGSRKGSSSALKDVTRRSPPPLPPRLQISPGQRRDTSEYRPDSLDIDEVDIPLHVLQDRELEFQYPETANLRHSDIRMVPGPSHDVGPAVPPHQDLDSSLSSSLRDDVFYDREPVPHHYHHVRVPREGGQEPTHFHVTKVRLPKQGHRSRTPERTLQLSRLHEYPPRMPDQAGDSGTMSSAIAVFDEPIAKREHVRRDHGAIKGIYSGQLPQPQRAPQGVRQVKHRKKPPPGLRIKTSADTPESTEFSLQNIWNKIFAASNSDRRRYGEGIIGKLFNRTLKRRRHLPEHVLKQLDDNDDFRPFFTYWVTTVQILVTVLSLIMYGVAPFGFFGRRQITDKITHRTLIKQQVAYLEQENFWVGPRFADLIHLGAKFSPCMRHDQHIFDVIEEDRRIENNTACCIYNDKSGCFQATEEQCPELLAVHYKWSSANLGPSKRISGSVCGQDPRACREPPSIDPYEWPDDITKWPICLKSGEAELASLPNLVCDLTGRPCCIGIHGQCRITTREYCDFVRGYFHEDAALCSQVSCMSEVCGMLPFFGKDKPDQWYRLFSSLFLHAGIIHLLTTIIIQMVFMRDFEKLIGWQRMTIIYIASGMGGYLASATFVPNIPEVGPAGSHFGLLAGLFADAWYSWNLIEKPWKAMVQLAIITFLFFLLGFLPWIDNWAHLFGFIIGLLLSLAVFPYIQFDADDPSTERFNRLVIVYVSLAVCILLIVALFLIFYVFPIWSCSVCQYFNCIPWPFLADTFCDNQGLDLVPMQGLEPI